MKKLLEIINEGIYNNAGVGINTQKNHIKKLLKDLGNYGPTVDKLVIDDNLNISMDRLVIENWDGDELDLASVKFTDVDWICIRHCPNLKSIKALSDSVLMCRAVEMENCPKLKSLEGLPNSIDIIMMENMGTVNLVGCPEELEELEIIDCHDLVSLKGAPRKMSGEWPSIEIRSCDKLSDISNIPTVKALRGVVALDRLPKVSKLNGFSKSTVNKFSAIRMASLTSLEGMPAINKGGTVYAMENPKLESIKGMPGVVSTFWVSDCPNLKTLEGGPSVVGDIEANGCGLTTLVGGPKEVGGYMSIRNNPDLMSFDGGPTKCLKLDIGETGIQNNAAFKKVKPAGCKVGWR